jgi:D-arabinose 1-dehydrogenase-like Zn-dependent alcohol dehydrogenase
MNSTMTAAVYTAYGAPEVLHLKTVDQPVPADNEVLIKVYATTVEATDAIFRQGTNVSARLFSGLLRPRFTIPGSEFAGKIEAVGKAVTRFKEGDASDSGSDGMDLEVRQQEGNDRIRRFAFSQGEESRPGLLP